MSKLYDDPDLLGEPKIPMDQFWEDEYRAKYFFDNHDDKCSFWDTLDFEDCDCEVYDE